MIEREDFRQHDAFAPGLDERAQRDAEQRHDDRDGEPQRDRDEGRPAPDAEPEWRRTQSLAAYRDVALRLLQQLPLHEHQRRGDRHDGHDDDRHELVGRHAELVGELVEIGRQHQHVLRIAQHQRQAEQFEAEEEDQHAREHDGGEHHRQADVDGDPQRMGAHRARRLFDVAAEPAQRGGRVEIDVRHMGEPGDRDQRWQRIEVPRHETEQALRECGKDADWTERHHVAEGQHDRRDENRNQDHGFEPVAARHVGARDQEGEAGAERHRDHRHAGCQQQRVAERRPELRIAEHERVGAKAQLRGRLEERPGEKALIENQR